MEKEITLFDILDDVLRGWYIFLLAILISLICSYFYFTNQKDIYRVSTNISKINDIEKSSLPSELIEKNVFNFFLSSIKSADAISDIIIENKLFKTIEIDSFDVYKSLSINMGTDSNLSFVTSNLSNLDASIVLEEYKTLILLLLKSHREYLFNILKQKYIDKLTLLDDLMHDEEIKFNNYIRKVNIDYGINNVENEKIIEVVYFDLLERIKNNLRIAIDFGIVDPIKPDITEDNSSINPRVNKIDLFKEGLLTIVNLYDLPLYKYGSSILKRELELMQEKFNNRNNNMLFSIDRINNEKENSRKFENTTMYIDLIDKIANLNRNINHLKLLEDSKFQFIRYDQNQINIESKKLSLYYISFIAIILSLLISFVINIYFQAYKRK